jgi:hypothetical protein
MFRHVTPAKPARPSRWLERFATSKPMALLVIVACVAGCGPGHQRVTEVSEPAPELTDAS